MYLLLPNTLVAAAVLAGSPASAQSAPGWSVGVSASASLIVGNASDFLDSGYGVALVGSHGVARHISVRADGMLIPLANSSIADETAGNTLVVLGLGPEVHVPFSAFTLFANPLLGMAANVQSRTNSVLAETTNWAAAFGGGAGLRLDAAPTWSLELGGDIVKLGDLDFARPAASSLMLTEDPAVLRVHLGFRLHIG